MKKRFLPLGLGIALIAGVVAAFATGDADNEAPEETADTVVLGEVDLAERAEILRNQFRRMTPGEGPLVQDVGAWPAAWDEFGPSWDAAPAERDLATWLVPFISDRAGALTILRDASGNSLWHGTTDFAKDASTNVILTGTLVDENEWTLYKAARDEVCRRAAVTRDSPQGGLRSSNDIYTNGLRFTNIWMETNGDCRMDFAWEANGDIQVFCRAMHTETWTNYGVVWTNDENEVVTNDITNWRQLDTFGGTPDFWDLLGVATISNGSGSFTDTNHVPNYDRVRFYASAALADSDNDGLTDGEEWLQSHSNPNNSDSDGDGIGDLTEFIAGLNPMDPDSEGSWLDDLINQPTIEPSPTSNAWWTATTTTNLYYRHYIDDRPSWPTNATHDPAWTWIFSTTSPWPNAVIMDVTITGFVDDAIKIDDHVVDWRCGTKSFDHYSIINEINDLQSDEFELTLWDWPQTNHSGPNEVRIGRTNTEPFVVEWTWGEAFDVQQEPIYTHAYDLPLDNPSGIPIGSNAWFHVNVWPDNLVPETNIVWFRLSGKIEFVTTNRGPRVQVRAIEEGADQLSVSVEGILGNLGLSPFHVQVKPLMVVTAKVAMVELVDGTNHIAAANTNFIANAIETANKLLLQNCLQIEWDRTILPIATDNPGYWNVVAGSTSFSNLCSVLSSPGGLEIYVVHGISSELSPNANGLHSGNGILIAGGKGIRSLAHEIGHACGANDIYIENSDMTIVLPGSVQPSRLPQDWGVYRGPTNWTPDQAYVVPRLLMFGLSTSVIGDIPSDDVYGLRRGYQSGQIIWTTGLAHVGLTAMTNAPISY